MKKMFEKTFWQGLPAVRFTAGGYTALIIPGTGANLIELTDTRRGASILRSPDDVDRFTGRPQVYGIPVLLPPNRIADGRFTVGRGTSHERTYHFPVTDIASHNHIHGFLKQASFEIADMREGDERAELDAVFHADASTDFHRYFPHEFTFTMTYTLSKNGLGQRITVRNESGTPMPFGLGFHTAFNIPFHPQGDPSSCLIKVGVEKRWELDERNLPTGTLHALTDEEEKLMTVGIPAVGTSIASHYTAKPFRLDGKEFHGAVIEDGSRKLRLVYETDRKYGHWMIWNEGGEKGFICPEPQTWAINAPNIGLSPELTGYHEIAPGQSWEAVSTIRIEEM